MEQEMWSDPRHDLALSGLKCARQELTNGPIRNRGLSRMCKPLITLVLVMRLDIIDLVSCFVTIILSES